jgi:hypothetical protein
MSRWESNTKIGRKGIRRVGGSAWPCSEVWQGFCEDGNRN